MPWILKHKRSTQPMIAEYLCPVHGRFTLTVDRDANGDPPAQAKCPTNAIEIACGEISAFAISSPGYAKVRNWEVVRGKWEKPERPTYFDTRELGEGQPLEEFRAKRAKVWEEHRYQENKELLR